MKIEREIIMEHKKMIDEITVQKVYRKTILHEYEVLCRAYGNEYVGEFRMELADFMIDKSYSGEMISLKEIMESVVDSKTRNEYLDYMYPFYIRVKEGSMPFDEYIEIAQGLDELNF